MVTRLQKYRNNGNNAGIQEIKVQVKRKPKVKAVMETSRLSHTWEIAPLRHSSPLDEDFQVTFFCSTATPNLISKDINESLLLLSSAPKPLHYMLQEEEQ